jgi:DNA-binding IclR family transcriptional regulator
MSQSLDRALDLIDFLASRDEGAGAAELVSELNLEKSAVSRILGTLKNKGWVREDENRTYRLTLKLIAMGLRQIENTDIYSLCYPKLFELSRSTGELVQLALVEDNNLVFVAKAEAKATIRVASLLGRKAVLHASAVAKVWLASLPDETALKLALNAGLKQQTPQTITTVEALQRELMKVRADGYAINDEESNLGIRGIAVPIRDRDTQSVVAAIAIVAPVFRLSLGRAVELVPMLLRAAEDLRGVSHLMTFEQRARSGERDDPSPKQRTRVS